tara:strand:- start:608321 stop:609631 length:1311 start_codon:yes stop_codon:yes gene_type:complete
MKFTILLLISTAITSSACFADNWAHWRGPTGNGVATEGQPPTMWSATENVKWKVEIPGKGSGSPVVWNDRVFVVTAVPTTANGQSAANPAGPRQRRRGAGGGISELAFKVLCFDRDTGSLLWQQTSTIATPHQATHATNGFASASPCTDGEHVYAHFGSRGLYCYTLDGQLKWKRDDFGAMNTRNDFGEGSSPTIAGNLILVPWDHEGPSALYALNKLTGETVWRTERNDEPTCWSTPLVVEHNGAKQVVMNGQTCARGYDLETGKELWRCGGQTDRPVASAVAQDDLVIVGSGFRGSFMGAFRMSGRGDIEGTDAVAWTLDRDTPDIASPLLSGGRVYFHKGKAGQLTCVDAATGKVHYAAVRVPGIDSTYASPIAAGGYVYLTGRSGNTVVIRDSDNFDVVATNSVGETVDATPAPVDNELFIRGERHLFCITH